MGASFHFLFAYLVFFSYSLWESIRDNKSYEVKKMDLAEIRHSLENTAKRLADFRGSL